MTSKQTPKLPPITDKQKEILLYLYKFRFLNTHQIQKLLNHKNPNRTLSWIKDLIEKKCINRHYDRKSFEDNTKPATYYLGSKARHILKSEKNLDFEQLEYIYSEHRREKKFISHCLFLADVYLFLLSQKEEKEDLKFFTKVDLNGYEYFPQPLPDAFIAVKGQDTKRYFLDLFDEYTPPFALRQRVRKYLEYAENSDWDENTDYAPLPFILIICPTESLKKHINIYTKSLLEKTYEDKISLFLTTKKRIEVADKENVWQKVVTE
jgi:hypothetical protein